MHMIGHSGSPDEPDPDGVGHWARRMSPPDNEIPAGIAMAPLLAASDDAAAAITRVEASSNGFRFTLAVRLRRRRAEVAPRGLFELLDPHLPTDGAATDQRLLLGLEYPDGRRASTLDDGWAGDPGAEGGERLVLVQESGSGSETSADQLYWVTPLPPDGPVAFIIRWPAFGIAESRMELDGGPIRAAASRSRILWPPQQLEPQPEPTPPRPTSGWFAQPPS